MAEARGVELGGRFESTGNSEVWDGFGKRTDQLNDPEWLAAFQKHWKFAPISPGKSSRLALVNLRDVLRRAAQMLAAGRALGHGEISKLNHALNVPVRQRLAPPQKGLWAGLFPVRSHGKRRRSPTPPPLPEPLLRPKRV